MAGNENELQPAVHISQLVPPPPEQMRKYLLRDTKGECKNICLGNVFMLYTSLEADKRQFSQHPMLRTSDQKMEASTFVTVNVHFSELSIKVTNKSSNVMIPRYLNGVRKIELLVYTSYLLLQI